jgi:hypothetical protein
MPFVRIAIKFIGVIFGVFLEVLTYLNLTVVMGSQTERSIPHKIWLLTSTIL